ncbi:MAG TPA: hypothetical protein VFK05_31645 [Polyangiaceae bacterium]|nr:hypothetical protein [Polyangiaceae bacterium]
MRSSSPRFGVRFGWFPLLAAAACLGACGGGHDDLAKRLASVQADLIKVQSHADRLEQRLESLEMRSKEAPVARPASEPAAHPDHPPLMVVKLEPDDSRDAPANAPTAALRPEDSAADQSPRPVIRVYGSRTDVGSTPDNSKRKR